MTTISKPWEKYRGTPNWKDLIPGYAGCLDSDKQVAFIQRHLMADPQLSYWWGWKAGMRRRAEAAIRRVAMHGDPECRATNVKLVRQAGRRAKEGPESRDSCVTKPTAPTPARLGRRRIETWESQLVRLAREGLSLREIASRLKDQGVDISYRSVARRLSELRGV